MVYFAVVIWVVCGLLQLANGQTACDNAVASLNNSTVCSNALLNADTTTVCTTCRDIFVAIDTNCDGQDTAAIREGFNAACGPCGTASQALQADTDCINAVSSGNANVICSGTCNTLLNNYVSSCRNQEGVDVSDTERILNMLCGGGNVSPECSTATNAVFSNTVCTTALNNDDSDTLCSATCRPLFETAVRLCPPNTLGISQADINQECGTTGGGSGAAGTVEGLGLLSLLLITTLASWL